MKKVLLTMAMAMLLPFALRAQITTFPWTEGFENGANGWTIIDSDGDGISWQLSDTSSQIASFAAQYPRTGNRCIIALSYDNHTYSPLTPDEWLISPAITIPTGESFTLSFYDNGTNPQYAAEHYTVHIATANTVAALSATTPVIEQTLTSGEWIKRSADLSAYAGQTIYIGFHHFNCTDQFCMGIDDIRVGGAETPDLTLAGPTAVQNGATATYTATSNVSSFTWHVDGVQQTETSGTLTTTFTTDGNHTVVVTATNAAGSTSDTIVTNVYTCYAITTFPFTEDFENGLTDCWGMVSMDNSNDDEFGLYADATAHSGANDFRFSSYSRATSGNYNQYLITPELSLDANTSYDIKFWYKAQRNTDTFYVKVSTTTNAVSAFTTVLASVTTPATDWTELVCNLPAGTKYVAINYCANYQYRLYVDDLYIGAPTVPSVSLVGPVTIKAGNTAVYTATSTVNTFSWTVDGVDQNTTGNVLTTSFTTAGLHTVIVGATNTVGTAYDTVVTDVFLCPAESLPFTADFTNGFGCWDTVSTTGTRWYLAEELMNNPTCQIISLSAQQSIFGMMDMGQDNWIISNEIAMSNGNYEISWRPFAFGAPNYAADHYSVYVISGTTLADTTEVFSETLTAGDTTFAVRVAAIPATVSGNFKIAFRHYNCVGGYALGIDSIKVQTLSAPASVSIQGPTSVMAGTSATYTAICANATSFAWTVDGAAQNVTNNTLTYTFNTTGNHTIGVTATNSIGTSAPASLTVNVYTCDAVTSFPWNEDFENGIGGCWSTIDANGDGYSWMATLNDNDLAGFGNNGSNSAYSNSYINGVGAVTPDNWLVTPAITLPATGSYTLSWFAGSAPSYPEEHYAVYVATANTEAAFSATNALYEETLTSGDWTEHNVSLANYAGQTVYVAFRHYNCSDAYILGIDDVTIAATTGIENVENAANVAIYPNPVRNMLTIEGNDVKNVEVIDMNGRVVLTNDRAGQLDMSTLAEGVYMVRVMSLSGVTAQKVVKK
jgi:hypothetical protein